MSLIGPRPELVRYTNQYEGEEKDILKVRPGITDFSSVEFINLDEIVGGENADRQVRILLSQFFIIFFRTVKRYIRLPLCIRPIRLHTPPKQTVKRFIRYNTSCKFINPHCTSSRITNLICPFSEKTPSIFSLLVFQALHHAVL